MEDFELFFLGVKETIYQPETIDSDITGIERRILRGTDKHSLLNKGKDTQGLGNVISTWWLMLDRKSTINVIINKEIENDICNIHGHFVRVHCNAGTRIIRTEATLTGFGTVWFENRCITNILFMPKAKNNDHLIYDREERNQFIMVMTDKEVLFKKSLNGLY